MAILSPSPGTERRIERVREYYGFVLYLCSFVGFFLYLGWTLVPDEVLQSLGITYYPNRLWALILPIWILGLIPFSILIFVGTTLLHTPSLTDPRCITDRVSTILKEAQDSKLLDTRTIPELQDVPLHRVSKILYEHPTPSSPWKQGPLFGIQE